jgi:hypothetical protein
MSLINAYSETVQQSIDVDLMDTKNVGNIILGYADYSYSQKFLCKFFDFFNKAIIENCVYVNEDKTKWYFNDKYNEVFRSFKYIDVGRYFGAVSIDEKEIVKVVSTVIIRSKNQGEKYYIGMNPRDGLRRAFEALFNLKINKKMAIATKRFSHNNDTRSVKALNYMETFPNAFVSCNFNFENNKYVKYFPNGFTLKEYVSEYLQIRGNPYDRWYTLYCGIEVPSEEQLEKVNKILNNDEVKITSENCILFNIDFGS